MVGSFVKIFFNRVFSVNSIKNNRRYSQNGLYISVKISHCLNCENCVPVKPFTLIHAF